MMATVVAYVPDLMDRSRISSAGSGIVVYVEQLDDLATAAAAADLVLVDLSSPGLLDVLPDVEGIGVRVVGFGPHIEEDLFDAARAAGCQQVLARSVFFSRLADVLA